MDIPPHEMEICLNVLQRLADEPAAIDNHARMKALIAKIHKTGKKGERRAVRQSEQAEDHRLRATTALVQTQRDHKHSTTLPASILEAAFTPPPSPEMNSDDGTADPSPTPSVDAASPVRTLNKPTRCYICKQLYTKVHFFYHLLCPTCATFNYARRTQRTNLDGRIALVTGGRIKIGYQTTLRLLRDGARVIVTTRFPHDAISRYAEEPDAAQWQHRLLVYGLDLRRMPDVEAFAHHLLDTQPHLDFLINNAAQTIQRPAIFYQHLVYGEQQHACPQQALAAGMSTRAFAPLNYRLPVLSECRPDVAGQSDLALSPFFPPGVFDADGQRLDMRPVNSWALRLHEVGSVEMLEVQLVNAVAPFVLNSRLKPLLLRSPFARRFIINVSAMEGQFNRGSKTPFHPHTNMAKAALNMMTRTCAADYAHDGIYMNSVDTGWITDENPHAKKTTLQEVNGFYTPLDVIDGMARIYDPIVQGLQNPNEPLHGHFLKDYVPYTW